MRRVTARALGLAAAAAVIAPRPAEACSCERRDAVWPADGATDVPINVEIVIRNGRSFGYPGSPFPGPGYALEGPDGSVAVEVGVLVHQIGYGIHVLRPLEPLAPFTTYTVRPGDEWDRLTATFRTGDAVREAVPAAIVIEDLDLAHGRGDMHIIHSCGNEYSYIDLKMTIPDDALVVEMIVTTDGEAVTYAVAAEDLYGGRSWWALSNHHGGCGLVVPLVPESETCVEVRARDRTGHVGPSARRCAVVRACRDLDLLDFDGNLGECPPPPEPEEPARAGGCSARGGVPPGGALAALALIAAAAALRSRTARARRCDRRRG